MVKRSNGSWQHVCVSVYGSLIGPWVSSPHSPSAGVGVQVGLEAVLEALARPRDQQPVQLPALPSRLQDAGQSRSSSQVGGAPAIVVCLLACFSALKVVFN